MIEVEEEFSHLFPCVVEKDNSYGQNALKYKNETSKFEKLKTNPSLGLTNQQLILL